ncbi:unnamed protein product [Adineta ricciae]|uniref:G-protein coupled receptors family 1 profile domain-containing protein n=1 Tax=Adineta ricciae TaxID=249248 RepID=A0A815ZJM8_ADIRI|nr:unnamed protein product [Adineta ricciae]CAF1586040.1 unnamed protein product [Adineta ricciae]
MSSQSTTTDYINSLQLTYKYLFQYPGSVMLVLGLVGSSLSCIVFNKKILRKNPCSIYMTAFHISNLVQIVTLILASVLSIGYGMTVVTRTLGLCRFNLYTAFALDVLSPSLLILASIDRILVTSPNALTRQRSTCRRAYISIVCVTLLWLLFHSHPWFLMSVIQLAPDVFICYTQSPIYLSAISYYTVIKSILIPSLLASLGILAIRNVHQLRFRLVAPDILTMGTGKSRSIQSFHARDYQLVRILLIDICVYVMCTYPQTAFNLYLQITQSNMKSADQIQADTAIQYICSFFGYIPYCVGFYTNLIVSKTFRNEVKHIFLCK